MLGRPWVRWVGVAVTVLVALSFAAVGDWLWTGLCVVFAVLLVAGDRRPRAARRDGDGDGSA